MTLTSEQTAMLKAPLDPKNVAGRQQGGGTVNYIEGWHAIAEANRIFGFDAWTRETVELRQLGEPREVNGKMRVDYMARIRIRVGDVIRDGSGFGQGIDKDVGQAHESALKEAETDAMKRALMTFGNPFGLALYDKSRANVQAAPEPVVDDHQWATITTLVEQTGVDVVAVCRDFGIGSLRELPAKRYETLRKNLERRLPARAA